MFQPDWKTDSKGDGATATLEDPHVADSEAAGSTDERSAWEFDNVADWYEQYLSLHACRRLGGQYTVCDRWWLHTEAVSRITALWYAWEELRQRDALGLSEWWVYHANPHLEDLLSKDRGPFANCKPGKHVEEEPLPFEPAPDWVRTFQKSAIEETT